MGLLRIFSENTAIGVSTVIWGMKNPRTIHTAWRYSSFLASLNLWYRKGNCIAIKIFTKKKTSSEWSVVWSMKNYCCKEKLYIATFNKKWNNFHTSKGTVLRGLGHSNYLYTRGMKNPSSKNAAWRYFSFLASLNLWYQKGKCVAVKICDIIIK